MAGKSHWYQAEYRNYLKC